MMSKQSIWEVLNCATKQLKETSPTARLDADLLLQKVLNCDRSYLLAHGEELINIQDFERFQELLARRLKCEPIAYILGQQEFYSRTYIVDQNVLCPRPETELIIEEALKAINSLPTPIRFVDLGTGSGCIAVTLALELRAKKISFQALALDLSERALELARKNAKFHDISDEICFLESDWFQALKSNQKFNLILANPPYIAYSDRAVSPGVSFEPESALYAEDQGLAAIKKILSDLMDFATVPALFISEIGWQQGETLMRHAKDLLQIQQQINCKIEIVQDLAGKDRFLKIWFN